jgi:hypothetical protein
MMAMDLALHIHGFGELLNGDKFTSLFFGYRFRKTHFSFIRFLRLGVLTIK